MIKNYIKKNTVLKLVERTKRAIFIALIAGIIGFLIHACKKNDDFGLQREGGNDPYTKTTGVYIVNEGNFNAANSSISFFDPKEETIANNIFSSKNQRPLGDVAQSITIYQDTAFIIVNNSGKIEVVNLEDFSSINTIEGLTSPRYMKVINKNKAYVSDLYDERIVIINPSTLKITGYIDLGCTSEKIVLRGTQAFVINWTGNQLIIINTNNDEVIKTLKITQEPNSMVFDKDSNLLILSSGGYMNQEFPAITKINTTECAIAQTYKFPNKDCSPSSLTKCKSGDTLFYINKNIYSITSSSLNLPGEKIIDAESRNFYQLKIDPNNPVIYATDAVDYTQAGYLFRFNFKGEKIDSLKAGLIPGDIIFNQIYYTASQSEN